MVLGGSRTPGEQSSNQKARGGNAMFYFLRFKNLLFLAHFSVHRKCVLVLNFAIKGEAITSQSW